MVWKKIAKHDFTPQMEMRVGVHREACAGEDTSYYGVDRTFENKGI